MNDQSLNAGDVVMVAGGESKYCGIWTVDAALKFGEYRLVNAAGNYHYTDTQDYCTLVGFDENKAASARHRGLQ